VSRPLRAFLTATDRHATKLSEILRQAPDDGLRALLDSSGNADLRFLPNLHGLLREVAAAASTAQKSVRLGRGRQADEYLDGLVLRLHDVFHVGTEGQHRRSLCFRNPEGGYTGDFYSFARDVLPVFGVAKGDDAIGNRIVRILKKRNRQRSSGRNGSDRTKSAV
jgi:hypothetical protein